MIYLGMERIALKVPMGRFGINGMAGSQMREIHEPEGRDESRFSLKSKRTKRHYR